MKSISLDELNRLRLLEGLQESEKISLSTRFVRKKFDTGEIIIHHSDEGSDVFFLIEGKVLATIDSPDGKSVIYRELATGETFGDYSAISGQSRSASVMAKEPCLIAMLGKEDFLDLMQSYPVTAMNEMRHLVQHVQDHAERIYELSTQATMDRLKSELIRMSESSDIEKCRIIPIPPRQSELAARIGSQREAVSRLLGKLERAGLISRHGQSLIIHNTKDLISHAA